MKIDSLVLPGVPQRGVAHIDPRHMLVIAQLAEISNDLDLSLGCSRCQSQLVGKNASTDGRWTIACNCRELTALMGTGRPA